MSQIERKPKDGKPGPITIQELQDRLKKFEEIIGGLKPPVSGRVLSQIVQARTHTKEELEIRAKMN